MTEQVLLHTVDQAARLLNIGRTTMKALIKKGEVESIKIGASRRISDAALREYVGTLAERTESRVDQQVAS
jgi:excisionase family DNA binding protein